MNDISHALLVMTAYIIALTTGSTIVRLVGDTQYVRFAVLLRNHLPVLLALIATILLFRGSRALVRLVPARLWSYRFLALMALPSWLFLISFTWQFYHAVPNIPSSDGIPRFSLPVKVLLFTYVLPHAVIWVLGLWSCINIAHYARLSPGSIYRSLFSSLARGILLVFACIFIAQFLIISSVAIARFSFATVMVYMTLVLIMIGFILVFHGVEQLHKIEKTIR